MSEPPVPEPPLPDGWIKCMSKSFKSEYYFNVTTNLSTWTHPALEEKVKQQVRYNWK